MRGEWEGEGEYRGRRQRAGANTGRVEEVVVREETNMLGTRLMK